MQFKNIIHGAVLVLSLFFLSAVQAENITQKMVLGHGLTLLVTPMPESPIASIYVWVKTGSAHEGEFLGSGISHFVEHMLFKGTTTRSSREMLDEARRLGGAMNASTGYDHTNYYINLPKDNFLQGLELLLDMVTNPLFDEKEFLSERDVVLKEVNMLKDHPDRFLSQLVYEEVYLKHPYRFPIIGLESFFKQLTVQDLKSYFQKKYQPSLMIVSIAGDVDIEKTIEIVKYYFEHSGTRFFENSPLPQEPEQIYPRYKKEFYPTSILRVVMAYPSIPLLHKDLFALDVLASALAGGESSRLYQDLYKKKNIVESVSASNPTPPDTGMFQIQAILKPHQDEDTFINAVKKHLLLIQKKGLTAQELKKIKRQVEVARVYEQQTPEGRAYLSAAEEAFAGDYQFSKSYLEGIRQVTNEDIKKVASKYFHDHSLSVIVLAPEENREDVKTRQLPLKLAVQKEVLPNGLTLLLKEDHSLPIVSIHVALKSGIREDKPLLEGVAQMTGWLWTKGVLNQNSDFLAELFESRGVSVSSSASRHTISFTIDCLSDDMGWVLSYLESWIKKPTFPLKDFDRLKETMILSLEKRKDSVAQMTSKLAIETLFLEHPFRMDGYGTKETLQQIQRQDIVNFYHQFLTPDNMVLSIVGDIASDNIKQQLTKKFSSLKKKNVNIEKKLEPFPQAKREQKQSMNKEQSMLMVSFRAPDMYDEDRYAFRVMMNMLTSPLGGRLFKRIREELGKAYVVSGSYSAGIDVGMASFYALTTKENLDAVQEEMNQELMKISSGFVSEQELFSTKEYLKSMHQRSLQTISAQSALMNSHELFGLGYDYADRECANIDAVTEKDILRVAKKYLDIQKATIVITESETKKP